MEREKERDKNHEKASKASTELEIKVQELQSQGLIRVERSASGGLDIQVVPVTLTEPATASANCTGQTLTISNICTSSSVRFWAEKLMEEKKEAGTLICSLHSFIEDNVSSPADTTLTLATII